MPFWIPLIICEFLLQRAQVMTSKGFRMFGTEARPSEAGALLQTLMSCATLNSIPDDFSVNHHVIAIFINRNDWITPTRLRFNMSQLIDDFGPN
jgi:hypothetical protein